MGNTVKEYSQMIGFLTRDKTSTVPRSMDQEPRTNYANGLKVDPIADSDLKIGQALGAYRRYRKRSGRRLKKDPVINFDQFFELYATENFSDGGQAGQLVQPNVDGSRPGYQGDNKYTSSKGTPGVKLDAKQIKNVQDDLVNFDGLQLTKKGNSYYIRFRLQKGENKISKQVTATPENIALVKKEQKAFMKTNYPNVLSNADFEQLRMLDENINLTVPEFTEVLNNKNKTTINGLPWNKATVQKLQGDLQLNDAVRPEFKGKKRKINVAKKIVRDFNPAELKRLNEIPDIDLRNKAIRKKASDITGQSSQLQKTGTLQGITKNREGSLWKNYYESSKRNNRIKLGGTFNGKDLSFRKNWPRKVDGSINWFIKDTKTNKPAWQMLEFIDTQTPKGEVKFTYDGLQNQVDDAFGKGHFARSTNAYSSGRELYGKNIMFEGKMQPMGRVIAKQTIINNYKANNNGKVPTEKYIQDRIRINTPTQVHHTKGIGNDPYTVQLVSRDANQKLNAAELTYNGEIRKAKGDPTKIKNLNSEFKKTINQLSNDYGGIKYDVDGKTVGRAATGESSYTSAIKESGISQKMQNKLLEQIASKNPKVAERVAIQFNSGIPVDQIMKELSRVPGMNKLARGFMKVGGPFEVAIVGLDAFNEFSKGKTGKQSLQTALSNLSFGAYEGGKREDMNVLLNTAENLNLDTAGFNEVRELQYLQKKISEDKKLLSDMAYYNKDQGGKNLKGSFDLKTRADDLTKLENEFASRVDTLEEKVDIKTLVDNYNKTTQSLAEQQFDKSKESRADRVYPEMGTLGSDIMTTIMNPVQSFLPQNLMETGLGPINNVTRPYVRAAAKYLDFMKPTSDAAILSSKDQDYRNKKVEEAKPGIVEDSQSIYYPKAKGGIMNLKKYYD